MQHHLLGYYLVDGHQKPANMWSGFPETLYTLSECICEVHPKDLVVFEDDADLGRAYRSQMGWSMDEFWSLRDQLMAWRGEQKYFFRSAFASLEAARAFAARWLKNRPRMKLLQAAVPEASLASYLRHEVFNDSGPRDVARLHQPVDIQDGFLGYDILGEDSALHCFLCNQLEADYSNLLQISFNSSGLVPDLDDALKAATYTNDLVASGTKLGFGFWFPVAMTEIPLQESVHV